MLFLVKFSPVPAVNIIYLFPSLLRQRLPTALSEETTALLQPGTRLWPAGTLCHVLPLCVIPSGSGASHT